MFPHIEMTFETKKGETIWQYPICCKMCDRIYFLTSNPMTVTQELLRHIEIPVETTQNIFVVVVFVLVVTYCCTMCEKDFFLTANP